MPPQMNPAQQQIQALTKNLTQQQMHDLQEYVKSQRQKNVEVTASMVQAWVQSAQADILVGHFFPANLASSPQATLQHLNSVLFPPSYPTTQNNPNVAQAISLASSKKLTDAQINILKAVVQHNNAKNAAAPAAPATPVQPPNKIQVLKSLQNRCLSIEALLKRTDSSAEQRAKAGTELEHTRTNILRVVRSILDAHPSPQVTQVVADVMASTHITVEQVSAFSQTQAAAVSTPAQRKAIETQQQMLQALADKRTTEERKRAAAAPAAGAPPAKRVTRKDVQASAVPSALTVSSPVPEAMPPPRPTLLNGLAAPAAVASPAIARHPLAHSENRPDGPSNGDEILGTISRRKVREIVSASDPTQTLTDDAEELLLQLADEFIDSITRFGCQLAKHRKSDRLEVKDLAMHLDKTYAIRIPGFSSDDIRPPPSKQATPTGGYATRANAVKESKKV